MDREDIRRRDVDDARRQRGARCNGGCIDQFLAQIDHPVGIIDLDHYVDRVDIVDIGMIGEFQFIQRGGALEELFLGGVAEAILVGIGLRRVGRDARGDAAHGNIPAARHIGRRLAGRIVDNVPDFIGIGQAIVIRVRCRRTGAELHFLPIDQAVAVGIAACRREGLAALTALQFIGIGEAVTVFVGQAVIGVDTTARRGEQAVTIGIGDPAKGWVPIQLESTICHGCQSDKAIHRGGEDVEGEGIQPRRDIPFEVAQVADRNGNIEGWQWQPPTFVGRQGIGHIEVGQDPLVQARLSAKRADTGRCCRLGAVHGGEQIFAIFDHILPLAAHLAAFHRDLLAGSGSQTVAEGAATQIVRRVEPKVGIDIKAIGRIRVFVAHGGRHRNLQGKIVASHIALIRIAQRHFGRAKHRQVVAVGVHHNIVVIEQVGNHLDGRRTDAETGAAQTRHRPQRVHLAHLANRGKDAVDEGDQQHDQRADDGATNHGGENEIDASSNRFR